MGKKRVSMSWFIRRYLKAMKCSIHLHCIFIGQKLVMKILFDTRKTGQFSLYYGCPKSVCVMGSIVSGGRLERGVIRKEVTRWYIVSVQSK